MFKSEAERIIRRAMEETGAKFTDEQIQALSRAVVKICAAIIEEAFSSFRPGTNSKPAFFGE